MWSVFYCSISFALFLGVITHLFSINMSWGSTVKSLKNDSCCKTIKNIFIMEKMQFVFSICVLVFTILFKIYYDLTVIMLLPLLSLSIGHFIVPFILNPALWCATEYEFDVTDTP